MEEPRRRGASPATVPLLALLTVVIVTACGGVGGDQVTPPLNLDLELDYRKLDPEERSVLTGLDDAERAALRLWKTQVLASGTNDGGIYFNVLNDPGDFSAAEVDLVRGLYNEEMAAYGGVNGRHLDHRFFDVALAISGIDIASRYAGAPPAFASGPVNLGNIATGDNGLSAFDNAVLRLWAHDLLDNGAMDGSITKFTLLSRFALNAVDGAPGSLDPDHVKALLAADLADGQPDGTPLRLAFDDVLDAAYLEGPGGSVAKVFNLAGIDRSTADALFADWAKRRGYRP